jgi:hypothetical protein
MDFAVLIFLVLASFTKFGYIPKILIRIFNKACSVLFDITLMTLVSFFLQRIKCKDANDDRSVPSIYSQGTMQGFDECRCDKSVSHFYGLFLIIVTLHYLILAGSMYVSFTRNKGTRPRIWDVSGFSALRFYVKISITGVICLADPAHFNYSSWIKCISVGLLVTLLLVCCINIQPTLGPESRKVIIT